MIPLAKVLSAEQELKHKIHINTSKDDQRMRRVSLLPKLNVRFCFRFFFMNCREGCSDGSSLFKKSFFNIFSAQHAAPAD